MYAPGSPSSALQITYLIAPGALRHYLPLPAGGEPSAASSSEAGFTHFSNHLFRCHAFQHLGEGRVAADGDEIFDRTRVDLSVLGEENPLLGPIERNLPLSTDLYVSDRVRVKEPLDHLSPKHRCIENLGHVLGRDVAIENIGGFQNEHRALFAESVASCNPQKNRSCKVSIFELLANRVATARDLEAWHPVPPQRIRVVL